MHSNRYLLNITFIPPCRDGCLGCVRRFLYLLIARNASHSNTALGDDDDMNNRYDAEDSKND
jgi:hypothetical protein